ncbi:MAG TPA: PAS domain S-box protein [Steroidobacteraceae bacterium]|nr:PAS domain S-box protein [Steroidobacteraceae bacterium]
MEQLRDDAARPKPALGLMDTATLRIFVNSVRDYAILMLDPTGHIMSWSPGAEAITGYAPHEIIGAHVLRFYPPEAIAAGLPERELSIASQTGRFEDEGWRVRKDGSKFWADVVVTALRDEQRELIGFAKVTRDLTERRRTEEALRHNEERFRSLIEGVKDYAIFMLDTKGFVSTWNAGAKQINGYEASEIIGSHFSRFYPPEALKRGLPEHELRTATVDGRFEDEGWRLRKDGSRFWANVIITAMRDASGTLTGFSKITRDLTLRKAQEERLRMSEERFRLLVDGVTEYALIMLDENGIVTSWNAGAQRIKGYRSDEILGKHYSHFYTPEDVAANKPWQQLARARVEGRVTDEGWRVRQDRSLYWAGTTITALHDADGRLHGFAKMTQDLTERRRSETLVDSTQRMHEFIAMLAHELRNPVAPIRNAVALMGRKGIHDPTLEAMRQTIDRQSSHLARLLDELLDVNRVARGEFSIQKEMLDLQDVLTRSIESSQPVIDAHGHRLHVERADAPLYVSGDPTRLTQAFVNILNNAAKYTPDGGDITLRVSADETEVEIRISDTGDGIAPEYLERVFELYVQIDPNKNGTLGGLGVGLALVRRVIELHAGHVYARSAGLGKGSEFVVRLPRSTQGLRAVELAAGPEPGARGSLQVLVVDDNRDAADTLTALVQSMEHSCQTVYDGESALRLAGTLKPDVIFMDIGLPHVSGYQIAQELRRRALTPRPLLVAVTGWGQEADRRLAIQSGFDLHFAKPVSERTIRAVLSEACGKDEAAEIHLH